jgi:hypothetical protein
MTKISHEISREVFQPMNGQIQKWGADSKSNSSRWLVVFAVVCAIGFVVVRYAPRSLEIASREPEVPAPTVHFSADDMDDVARHLQYAAGAEADATAALKESQDWLGRALPYLDDDRVAARRLYLARAAQNSAASSLARSREELDIAKGIFAQRGNKQ